MEDNLLKVSKRKMILNGVIIGLVISFVYLVLYEFILGEGELQAFLSFFSALIIMLTFSILLGRKDITNITYSSVSYKKALINVSIMCLITLIVFIFMSFVVGSIFNLTGRISSLIRDKPEYVQYYQQENLLGKFQLSVIIMVHSLIGGISALLTILIAPLFIKCKKQ